MKPHRVVRLAQEMYTTSHSRIVTIPVFFCLTKNLMQHSETINIPHTTVPKNSTIENNYSIIKAQIDLKDRQLHTNHPKKTIFLTVKNSPDE
jgi:hypothetical protein